MRYVDNIRRYYETLVWMSSEDTDTPWVADYTQAKVNAKVEEE